MNNAEKKILADEIFSLAALAEMNLIDNEQLVAKLWKLGNTLRDEIRSDANAE